MVCIPDKVFLNIIVVGFFFFPEENSQEGLILLMEVKDLVLTSRVVPSNL